MLLHALKEWTAFAGSSWRLSGVRQPSCARAALQVASTGGSEMVLWALVCLESAIWGCFARYSALQMSGTGRHSGLSLCWVRHPCALAASSGVKLCRWTDKQESADPLTSIWTDSSYSTQNSVLQKRVHSSGFIPCCAWAAPHCTQPCSMTRDIAGHKSTWQHARWALHAR